MVAQTQLLILALMLTLVPFLALPSIVLAMSLGLLMWQLDKGEGRGIVPSGCPS